MREGEVDTPANGKETSERPANCRQSQTGGQSCKWSLNHGIKKHLSRVPSPPSTSHVISDHSGEKKRQMLAARVAIAGAKLWVTGFFTMPASINVLQCFLAEKHNELA